MKPIMLVALWIGLWMPQPTANNDSVFLRTSPKPRLQASRWIGAINNWMTYFGLPLFRRNISQLRP